MDRELLNWGVLSCARIAEEQVIPAILSSENGRLRAVAGRNADRRDEFVWRFCPDVAYASYDELLDDPEVDAVYIALPNGLHCEWTVKALKRGKHVLCEKPMACNRREAETMASLARERELVLMEAFAFRHSPLTHKVKQLVEEGRIGSLQLIEACYCFRLEDPGDIRFCADLGGGCMLDEGSYNIAFITYIAGQSPSFVAARGQVDRERGIDMNSNCLLEFPGGLRAVCHSSMDGEKREEYRLIGSRGILEVRHDYNASGLLSIRLETGGSVEQLSVDCPNNYRLEVEQFGRCVLQEEAPEVSLEETCRNVAIVEEITRQIFAGQDKEECGK